MDLQAIQNQLLQIKRRRIELRGFKANLDMEDLDLENRQAYLERMIFTQGRVTPVSSVGNRQSRSNTSFQPQRSQTQHQQQHHVAAVTGNQNSGQEAESVEVRVKQEPQETRKLPSTTIVIDDDEDDEVDTDSDIVPYRRKSILPDSRANFKSSQPPAEQHSETSTNSEASTERALVSTKRSMVTNVPVDNSRLNQKYLKSNEGIRTPVKNMQHPNASQPSSFRKPFQYPSRQINSAPRPTSQPFQTYPSSSSSSSPPSAIMHKSHLTNPIDKSSRASVCPCQGRNSNCQNCTITIASKPQSQPQTSTPTTITKPDGHSSNQSTSPSNQTPSPMSVTEKENLELIFCRRVVFHLFQLGRAVSANQDIPHTSSQNPIPVIPEHNWISAMQQSTAWRTVMDALRANLKSKVVPQEDDSGVWTGSKVATKFTDLKSFTAVVKNLTDDLTSEHPESCCGGDEEDGDECWGPKFLNWFYGMVAKGRACVETCATALDKAERQAIVEKWKL